MMDRNRMDKNPEPSSLAGDSRREPKAAQHLWGNRSQRLGAAFFSGDSSLLLILVMLVLIGTFWVLLRDTAFMSVGNFMNIVKAKTPVIVMAAATVFVISAGEIDLSVASVPPVAGTLVATLLANG